MSNANANTNTSLRKKLIILIAIVVVLVVAVLVAVNMNGKSDVADSGAAATTEEGQGLVVEDEVTVEVNIPEDESGSEESAEE
jgi:flagellar basal body-associated protein FliL